ncbi:hypothetical protein ACUR5C_08345 [Aliikangiella sp. IMCC44653]
MKIPVDSFNAKDFHRKILSISGISLKELEQQINSWINTALKNING